MKGLSKTIHSERNNCNFNCGSGTVIAALNVFNDFAFKDIPQSTTGPIDAILHLYFKSKQDAPAQRVFYENITNYFNISVL